ncbi:bifunctional adenosylcobinamide kinase/adenosylcobinamide-phosphate guanylyltransferase [Pararhodobacter aggregans]|uniref:Bifunctional adenosylcobalamin biosynthesis protein n=1 Tax=Pararhodobacter aggregans TaxID=404875 RepID=A0A2T7UM07_9RHOB|nr:bifunctional adenosylcobinamide kinase/adenosylcobinamide-phosphate guanylyltransferase [Pararhodobacter aggregans]PTX02225.1 adenosylcobinamide kinase /adenosylcobinamide-phosphate guanylyltransferase [Pararhodobacter aggregans]PVE45678.1 bifunctional adenosylcobinamide kinase/adenosylcobinamide-phosphate guanylyltransferase [Pararhodobacter aggregans]
MSVTLVLGGARSGKSALAERLTLSVAQGAPLYIATAQAWDDEMRERIALHRAQRDGQGWQTLEVPLDLAAALSDIKDQTVLIDCLTLWLTNHLLAEHDLAAETATLLSALAVRAAPTILVSNEVGLGIVPDNALARRFRDDAGRLNQRVAALADTVVFTAAGLPMVLKGALPPGF